jgi:signal transduction histidine kinase
VVFTNLSDQVFVIELSDLKSRFVSTTSHEFRTPLSAILSSAELLERYGARWEDDRRLRHLHQIEAAARHMAQLLEDVLTIGRAEAGQLVCHPTALDLGSFCRDLVDEMGRITLPGQTIALSERDLPVPAWLDEKLLREILTNLLSNAIKYSPAGQPIALTAVRCGPDVVLSVTDQGIGIPLADQARLYEAFHRAANVGTIPGTGLGLAVLKKAVDTHGGRIECESAPGQGTIFTVTLRAAQPAGQPEPCDA